MESGKAAASLFRANNSPRVECPLGRVAESVSTMDEEIPLMRGEESETYCFN